MLENVGSKFGVGPATELSFSSQARKPNVAVRIRERGRALFDIGLLPTNCARRRVQAAYLAAWDLRTRFRHNGKRFFDRRNSLTRAVRQNKQARLADPANIVSTQQLRHPSPMLETRTSTILITGAAG